MAHNNGPHKRGLLRPGGAGSRIPFFIIIALAILCVIMLYNVYTGTGRKNELQEEVDVLRVKNHMCSKDKIDSEKKYEMYSKSMKQKSDTDNQKVKTLQATNSELSQQFKTVNEQLTELKDSKKSLDEQLAEIVEAKQKIADNLTQTLEDLASLRAENEQLKAAAAKTVSEQKEKPSGKINIGVDSDVHRDHKVDTHGVKHSDAVNRDVVESEPDQPKDKPIGKSGVGVVDDDGERKLSASQVIKSHVDVDKDGVGLEDETRSTMAASERKARTKKIKSNLVVEDGERSKNVGTSNENVIETQKKVANLSEDDTKTEVENLPSPLDLVTKKRGRNKHGRRNKTKNSTNREISANKKESVKDVDKPGPPGPPAINADGEEKNDSHLEISDIQTKNSAQNGSVDVDGNKHELSPSGPDLDVPNAASSSSISLGKKSDPSNLELHPSRGLLAPLPTQLPDEVEKVKPTENEKEMSKNDEEKIKNGMKSGENKDEADEKDPIQPSRETLPSPKPPNISYKLKTNDNKAKEDYLYRDEEETPASVGVESSKNQNQIPDPNDDKGLN